MEAILGVLVQTNFGGVLTINGAPVGQELGRYYLRNQIEPDAAVRPGDGDDADGSVIIVVGTDAPVDARNLERLAARAMFGLARTGAAGSNGSGVTGRTEINLVLNWFEDRRGPTDRAALEIMRRYGAARVP